MRLRTSVPMAWGDQAWPLGLVEGEKAGRGTLENPIEMTTGARAVLQVQPWRRARKSVAKEKPWSPSSLHGPNGCKQPHYLYHDFPWTYDIYVSVIVEAALNSNCNNNHVV